MCEKFGREGRSNFSSTKFLGTKVLELELETDWGGGPGADVEKM